MTSPEPPPGERPAEPAVGLPPGQHLARGWPVLHYGPVPSFRPATWDLRVTGRTADRRAHRWTWDQVTLLPTVTVRADLHCVTRFTVPDNTWRGVPAVTLLQLAPPAPDVTHVMVVAEYGYSTSVPLADFADERVLLATHHDGRPLSPERGAPLRLVVPHLYAWKGPKWVREVQWLSADRKGFWEQRGYHPRGDPWLEQRYAYQDEG